MSYWWGLLLLPILPLFFVGYYKLAKEGLQEELEIQVDTLENKLVLTENEKLFIKTAKEYLNNLEKND